MEEVKQSNLNLSNDKTKTIKVTIVGDGTVGKTCMLISYTANTFPEEYVPTVFDNHAKTIKVDGLEIGMTLWDTAGQEEYEKLRPLSYPKTDCFILCYAVDNPASLANVEIKWMPELRQHCPKAAIVLVGTKSDLLSPNDQKADQDGKRMKSKIKANRFLLCSAKTRENLSEVFDECVRAVLNPSSEKSSLNCCKVA